MFNQSPNSTKTPFLEHSVNGLTVVSAGVVTFFAQPFVNDATNRHVTSFAADHYGSAIAFGISPIWWLLSAAAIFLITNLTFKLIFSTATIAFFRRLF